MISRIFLAFLISFSASALLVQHTLAADYVAAVYEHFTRTALRPNVTYEWALKIMNENLDVYEKQIAVASKEVSICYKSLCFFSVLSCIHTLCVHYARAAANLNSGYSKYAKVARALFLYNCTPNISRSADASVSIAFG